MKVIVASFSKTGTKTLCAALNVLGYKVYDAVEHFWYHGNDWIKILTTGGTVEDFKRMYKDVDAVTDAPACNFWEEISEAFPDAKIVLTLRDEESWWRSLQKQFERLNADVSFKISHYIPYLSTYRYYKAICMASFGLPMSYFSGNICTTNKMVPLMKFRQHNDHVLQAAPCEKLLVFKITDGWEPLCKFLEKDVPDEPFPHKNPNGNLLPELRTQNLVMKQAQKKLYVVYAFVFCIIALPVFVAVIWPLLNFY